MLWTHPRDGLVSKILRLLNSTQSYSSVEFDSNLLESLQIEGVKVVTGAFKETCRVSLLNELPWVDFSVGRKLHRLSLMNKMVFKLAPPFLCDLCPDFVSDRSCYVSVLFGIFAYLTYLKIKKKTFLFSSIKWWNSLPLELHTSSSLGYFKHILLKYLQFPTHNYLFFFYIGARSPSISHTCLRLNFSALK